MRLNFRQHRKRLCFRPTNRDVLETNSRSEEKKTNSHSAGRLSIWSVRAHFATASEGDRFLVTSCEFSDPNRLKSSSGKASRRSRTSRQLPLSDGEGRFRRPEVRHLEEVCNFRPALTGRFFDVGREGRERP